VVAPGDDGLGQLGVTLLVGCDGMSGRPAMTQVDLPSGVVEQVLVFV